MSILLKGVVFKIFLDALAPGGAYHRLRREAGDVKSPLPFIAEVCHLKQHLREETPAEWRVTP